MRVANQHDRDDMPTGRAKNGEHKRAHRGSLVAHSKGRDAEKFGDVRIVHQEVGGSSEPADIR